jgi:hypothetical protein
MGTVGTILLAALVALAIFGAVMLILALFDR